MQSDTSVDYLREPLDTFLSAAAAKQPTPGGGSVASLASALGVALAEMAARYSVVRQTSENAKQSVEQHVAQLVRARAALRRLIDEDMAAYEALAAARKIPADVAGRDDRTRDAARVACLVPLEIAALSATALAIMAELTPVCSPYLRSDLRGGAILAEAAGRAAAENVRVNLPEIAEPERSRLHDELTATLGRAAGQLDRVLRY